MNTIVEQIEKWYSENGRRWSTHDAHSRIRLMEGADQIHGKVVIELQTPHTVATITVWNKGDVEVLGVDKKSRKDWILDDRKLTAADDIAALLEGYFQEIITLNDLRGLRANKDPRDQEDRG